MDLLNTILACSLYLADDDLVRAIAQSNSHSNPYFVEDATLVIAEVDPACRPRPRPRPSPGTTTSWRRTAGLCSA